MSEAQISTVEPAKAQASKITFELHTLGWEAFQNLCGCVLRENLGQTYTVFSSTNDAGQDGAFQGTWEQKGKESYAGRFVVQCKFTCKRDSSLSLSNLEDELEKAERLAAADHASTYLLVTNAKVSGASDKLIREAFLKIPKIKHFDILGEEWLTDQIRESRRLRALVPRLYGLGDLSQILDERVYQQANELLQSWKENLAKFVPTAAHRKSVEALQNKRFVMLLGDPMAGKSTISAALALAAADNWGCSPVFATDPDDFKRHWNPDEPKQFFWIDDAFGQTQYNGALAQGWNRVFPLLATAIKKGARVVFTSRTNIYNAAKRDLKLSSFPLLTDSQVLVEVEKLGLPEKERILYNHLRMGEQPVEFRAKVKPFLPAFAEHPKFLPEIARRLGDPAFTQDLSVSEAALSLFVEEPTQFLIDVIKQLSDSEFAALALIFMRSGQALIPLELDQNEGGALAVINAGVADLRLALVSLEGVLVKKAYDAGSRSWKFSHPTIREAIASIISSEDDLLDIYLAGAKASEIVNECACGVSEMGEAKILIPPHRFSLVIEKLDAPDSDAFRFNYYLCRFLGTRCSKEFLALWVKTAKSYHSDFIQRPRNPASNSNFCSLISKLKEFDLLDENIRLNFIKSIRSVLENDLDSTGLDPDFSNLLSSAERAELLDFLRHKVLPIAKDVVDDYEADFDPEYDEPSYYLDDLDGNIRRLYDLFDEEKDEDDIAIDYIDEAYDEIREAVDRLEEKAAEATDEDDDEEEENQDMASSTDQEIEDDELDARSIFDDVDA
ncbi:hypothetical protein SH580_13230 [Coraliomargarita algicola]|uniref:Novel STAND NTPase 3 domain-containing protein n=1 Tax=Coraliomargarita algicola TaxID=3092156 RepID=A0ABZ0RG65_9BACT|nr:hypothetical protein [Coraliomargarita sp. J2-16]WPJ94396.1 hypothetical protein SH580_13230 [Coraliomargarita sp. J2-16]